MSRSTRSARQVFWQSHLDKIQAQGLSIRAYAHREGLSEQSLYAARRRSRASLPVTPVAPGAFAAVRIAGSACELSLPGGVTLRLPEPPPASWLAVLLRELSP